MKAAVIFAIPAASSQAYCWKWRSADASADSTAQFLYYYDCLADAKANGYAVEMLATYGNTSPAWRSLSGSES